MQTTINNKIEKDVGKNTIGKDVGKNSFIFLKSKNLG